MKIRTSVQYPGSREAAGACPYNFLFTKTIGVVATFSPLRWYLRKFAAGTLPVQLLQTFGMT